MTRDTAAFLLALVDGLTLNVGAPDFDEVVARVQSARAELRDTLNPPADVMTSAT